MKGIVDVLLYLCRCKVTNKLKFVRVTSIFDWTNWYNRKFPQSHLQLQSEWES